MRYIFLQVALAVVTTVSASAQPQPGDIIVAGDQSLQVVTPRGQVTTLVKLPAGHTAMGICPSLDNQGVAVQTLFRRRSGDASYFLEVRPNGRLTTLGMFTHWPGGPIFATVHMDLVPEQRGDYIAASSLGGTVRVDGGTGAVTTINSGFMNGVTDNLLAGGWLTYSGGYVYDIDRSGTLNFLGDQYPSPVIIGGGSIFADTVTGNAFVTARNLLHFDVSRKRFTTLASGPPFAALLDGDIDPRNGTLVVADSQSTLFRLDRQGSVLGTIARVTGRINALTILGSNHVQGLGLAAPGSPYWIQVSFPAHPGLSYHLGASFGITPGISTPFGRIPLNPDNLLASVFQAPQVFRNFGGKLDGTGVAAAILDIPPGVPRGLRLFLAAVVFKGPGQIVAISEPVGLTIE